MIRTILFTAMAAALVVSCSSGKKGEETAGETANLENTINEPTDSPVVSGDIVYVDLTYLSATCKLSLTEGVVLEEKAQAYEKERTNVETSLQNKEQAIQADVAKNEENYRNTMITSITYQQRLEELQRRYVEFQETVNTEATKLAKKEQSLLEEQQVLAARFAKLVKLAVDNLNIDNKYKMVVTTDVIISADESLNISALVLAEMDKLYDEGALN